jgi:hypothetical protein
MKLAYNVALLLMTGMITLSKAEAGLAVVVSRPKITGNKAVIKLEMKNSFNEPIQSARATAFLLADSNKIVGQSTKWVIGGEKGKPSLAVDAAQSYNFVISSATPITATNLISKVSFSRIILSNGTLADPGKDAVIPAAH